MKRPTDDIPERMRNNVLLYFGESGREWLAALPSIIAEATNRWGLQPESPFTNLSINFVLPARDRDGRPVVLKAGVPNPELCAEIEALRFFNGEGMVRLIDADPPAGLVLLERILPGSPVLESDDDRAVDALISVTERLRLKTVLPSGHSFPSLRDWFRGFALLRGRFGGGSGPIPFRLLERAEGIVSELLASTESPVLLHGDLHHENMLLSVREGEEDDDAVWLAIDPKGVVGDPLFEFCPFLRNSMPALLTGMNTQKVLERRIDRLCEILSLDRPRLLLWASAESIL